MTHQLTTLPVERRAGIAGRHIVSVGKPATKPGEAMVSGNGRLLFSCLGDPWRDRLVLQCEELAQPQWSEPPKAPLIAGVLEEVRGLMREGKHVEAVKRSTAAARESGTPDTLSSNPTHPAIILELSQVVEEAADYLFTLDLRTSLVTARWVEGGEVYRRELFASRADDLTALRASAPAGRLNLTLRGVFTIPRRSNQGLLSANNIPGAVDSVFTSEPVPPQVSIRHTRQGILLNGVYAYQQGGYSAVVRAVVSGGDLAADADGLHVSGADTAVFLLTARRNYGAQPAGDDEALLSELEGIDANFDRLLARHAALHHPLFERVELDLGGDPADYLLTGDELKRKQFLAQEILPAYAEMMVDRGRFFLLNECGRFPPIHGHVNVNINHQVSGGITGALPEMIESFLRWIEWQLPDARENAQRIFGARGFVIATHPDQESGRLYHFNEFYPHHYWTASSGWCLQPFLEYYQCTGDADFLRQRMLPLYKELALFYADFLTPRDEHGKRMFIPSYSPENFPANVPCMAVINAVMDISVCREVLETLLVYAPGAGMATEVEIAGWRALLAELPPYLLGEYGELKEWARADLAENYDHRHSSHLYGAYPGHEFQPELNPALFTAARIANRMRVFGNESFHGIGHRAQAAARLKDAYLLEAMLRLALESGYVNDNFTTVHNPYQAHAMPDAQGALPTILYESLLYSRPGFIEPLPALPRSSFRRGSMRGTLARCFAAVDELAWDLDAGWVRLALLSRVDQEITACYRAGFEEFSTEGVVWAPDAGEIYRQVQLKAGERAVLRWDGVT